MERGVRKGGKKGGPAEKEGGCVTRTNAHSYAAVIWREYKTDKRERMHVQLTHLHTVFVCVQKCLTGLQ